MFSTIFKTGLLIDRLESHNMGLNGHVTYYNCSFLIIDFFL